MHQSEYGSSMGGYRPVEGGKASLNLRHGGLDVSQPPDEIEEGMTPYSYNVRFDRGGVAADYDVATFDAASASAADKTIMKMAPFELSSETKFMMRLRPTRWDRWDGASWFELPGTLTGNSTNRLYTAIYGDFFVAANGVDKLKMWNGVDATAVADLSADSPIATYIVKVGTRLVAARVRVGPDMFPYRVMWTADGNILDWTTALNGAGNDTLAPEGGNRATNLITGLSTLEGAGVIYRQRSIVMMVQTGIGASPFKFVSVDFGHGTYSPYSIGNGGMRSGDYFLGDDLMVYFFDGKAMPVPIGDPIFESLKRAVYDPKYVVGTVDVRNQEYVLAYAIDSSLALKRAYAFSIRDWVKNNRLVWRHRDYGSTGYTSIDYGAVPTSTDPFVDSVSTFVDDDGHIVDDYASTQGDERILLGDAVGQARYVDLSSRVTDGIWTSKALGDDQIQYSVDRVRLRAYVTSTATIEVSISTDGQNFLYPKVYTFSPSGVGTLTMSDYFGVDVTTFQFQIRILSGDPVISKILYTLTEHGKAA